MEKSVVDNDDIYNISSILLNEDFAKDKALKEIDSNSTLSLLLIAVAVDLELNTVKIKEVKEQLTLKNITQNEGFAQILKLWKQRNGVNASRGQLMSVLSANGLGTVSERMKTKSLSLPIRNKLQKLTNDTDTGNTSSDILSISRKAENVSPPLLNSVVLETIFYHLKFGDWTNMRLVNHNFLEETLPFWRKSVVLEIVEPDDRKSLTEFGEHFKQDESNENWSSVAYNLLKHPFRSIYIDEEVLQPPHLDRRSCENTFWELCGPGVIQLDLFGCRFYKNGGLLEMLKWVLLEACPKLKLLNIFENIETEEDKRVHKSEQNQPEDEEAVSVVAENFESLKITGGLPDTGICSKLFQILPKLKEVILDSDQYLNDIWCPTINGQQIELEKLNLTCRLPMEFSNLLRSTQQFANTITHLKFSEVNLTRDARAAPYNFYSSIRQCRNLNNLDLSYICNEDVGLFDWFTDLSDIPFPKLTNLKIEFNTAESCIFNYDFSAFGGMQKLESCSIVFVPRSDPKPLERKLLELSCWEYLGQQDSIAPAEFLKKDNIRHRWTECEHLKKLKLGLMMGWELDSMDIDDFVKRFPNLEYLHTAVEGESLLWLLHSFPKLKTLVITNKWKLDIEMLYQAKLQNEHVTIIYDSKALGRVKIVKQGDTASMKKLDNFVDFSES